MWGIMVFEEIVLSIFGAAVFGCYILPYAFGRKAFWRISASDALARAEQRRKDAEKRIAVAKAEAEARRLERDAQAIEEKSFDDELNEDAENKRRV
jgi:hypothetical protein